jgi:hypothetical protein
VETVLAEKVVTALARGETNTRERDWADIWRLTNTHNLHGASMQEAIHRTSTYRGIELRPLSASLGNLVDNRASRYRIWLRQQGLDAAQYPDEFAAIVSDVVAFADPLLAGHITDQQWSPQNRRWG